MLYIMAKCFNRNTKGFKELLEVHGDALTVDLLINDWQDYTGSDSIPGVEEVKDMQNNDNLLFSLRSQSLGSSLLRNLANKKIISKYNNKWYVNVTVPGKTEGNSVYMRNNVSRLKNYVRNQNLGDAVSLKRTRSTFEVIVNNDMFTKQDLIKERTFSDPTKLPSILDHLTSMFPEVKVNYMTPGQAKKAYNELPAYTKKKVDFADVKSFYWNGNAVLIKGRITEDTAVEEVLHPFVNSLKTSKPKLFNKILEEAKKTFPVLAQQIEASYSDKKGFYVKDRNLELVTQALSRHFNKEYENTPSKPWYTAITDFLKWFNGVISKVYTDYMGGTMKLKVGFISSDMNMSDLAKMLNTSEFSFDLNLTEAGDRMVQYSLSEGKQKLVDTIRENATTDTQLEIIDNLLHQVEEVDDTFDSLGTSRVIIDNSSGEFVDLDNKEKYESLENTLWNESANKRSYAHVIEGIINNDLDFNIENLKEFEGTIIEYVEHIGLKKDGREIGARNVGRGKKIQVVLSAMKEKFKNKTWTNPVNSEPLPKNTFKTFEEFMLFMYLHEKAHESIFRNKGETLSSYETRINNEALRRLRSESNLLQPVDSRGIGIKLESFRDDGSVIIPGVILADVNSNIATMATALKISPDGAITVIDLKKTSEINKASQATFINTQRRILENLGYDVTNNSHTILIGDNNQYSKTNTYKDSQNEEAVEELVPEDVNENNRDIIDEIIGKERNIEGNNPVEDLTADLQPEFLDSPVYDSIFSGLKEYRKTLITREKALATARSIVSLDKGRKEIIEEIQITRQLVEQMYEEPEEIQNIYTEVLIDSIRQVKEFKDFATDPDNFGKPEFISKILNWRKFVESYRGLVNLTGDLKGMNATANSYKNQLQSALNDIVGVKRVSDNSTVTKGIFDIAIANHVKQIIAEKSNRNFTAEQLEELMTSAIDINAAELQSGDMATSRDGLLAQMDKIYKRDRQIVLDKIEARAPRIRAAALKLSRLNYGKTIDYSFMLEFDSLNEFTGRYVKRTGKLYYDKLNEIRSVLFDDNGFRQYITIENEEDATIEQLEHNKKLARDKKEYTKFRSAETKTDEGVEDGEYHKYTEEFKKARDENEVYIYNERSGVGRWVKRNSVSKPKYRKFINKYYDTLEEYQRVQLDRNGDPTGVTEMVEGVQIVKAEYSEINDEVTSTGKSLVNEKWSEIQNSTTELGKAQKQYYDMFVDVYEKELMEKLPENVNMLGKVPIIQGETNSKMKDKRNIVSKIYTGFKKWGSGIIHPTTTVKKTFTDEHGSIITDSIPLFFTGSAKSEKVIRDLANEVLAIEEEYKNADSQKVKDEVKAKLAAARGKLKSAENMPTKAQLSMDMTDSLLKFSAMAENYETMAAAEDTHLAMMEVLKSRIYKDKKGSIKNTEDVRMVARARKWMKMVFYNNDNDVKTFWDKLTKGLISYTSLAYVGTNVFGNINNYAFGRLSNSLETAGARFYSRKGMAKAVIDYNKRMLPDLMRSLSNLSKDNLITGKKFSKGDEEFREDVPHNKYGAMVAFFRMMDPKADMRESGDVGDMWNKYTSWAYVLQDIGEFNVQSKIGMAVLHSVTAINPVTKDTMSLYDALSYDRKTGEMSIKEGYTQVKLHNQEKVREWNADARYEIRNYIREVNKQTHGNYNYEDRMVMQSNSLGQLAAQFHKWCAPAVKARFRPEYFDENLGWMEGRYLTFWNFLGYAYKNIGEIGQMGANYKEFHGEKGLVKLQNVHRVMGEIAIIFGTYLAKQMLMTLWDMHPDDDDDSDYIDPMYADPGSIKEISDLQKRLRNILVYQLDRLHDESIMWVPIAPGGLTQLGHFIQNPIAASRTLGEIGQAIEMTAKTGISKAFQTEENFLNNKDVVYQRGTRAGTMKLGKEWGDAAPFLYTMNKWKNFIQMNDFYIK